MVRTFTVAAVIVFFSAPVGATGSLALYLNMAGPIQFSPDPPDGCFNELTIPLLSARGQQVGIATGCILGGAFGGDVVDGEGNFTGYVQTLRSVDTYDLLLGHLEVTWTIVETVSYTPTGIAGEQSWSGVISGGTGIYRRAEGRAFGSGVYEFNFVEGHFEVDADLAFLLDR